MKIIDSLYKDVPSVVLESNDLQVSILPRYGAKIASIYSKKQDFEYLVQNPGETYRKQNYDGSYVLGECSGFDDMFPTIDQCFYEDFPWKGTVLPDHGEVWSLEWESSVIERGLMLAVSGVRLPYRLEKILSIDNQDTLKMEYRLFNSSPFPINFLWAAHVMINIMEGTRLILPPSSKSAMAVFSKSGRIGRYGDTFSWPFPDISIKEDRLDVSRSTSVEDMEKYYMKDPLDEGYCLLDYPDGKKLRLGFSPDTVPYLGILMNENGWNNNGTWEKLYNIFLEPCTASMDRVDVAVLRGQCSVLPPNGEYKWELSISMDF